MTAARLKTLKRVIQLQRPVTKKAADQAKTLSDFGDYELLEEIGRGGKAWCFARTKRV